MHIISEHEISDNGGSGMTKNNWKPWIPALATLVASAAVGVVYALTIEEKTVWGFLQIFGMGLVPFVFPVYGLITKKQPPVLLAALTGIHVVLASECGSALDWYIKIPFWDLAMHAYFGFIGSAVAYVLLVRWNAEGMNKVGFFLMIGAVVIACAGIWEIVEYVTDLMTGSDALKIEESVAAGKHPSSDTMEDMLITFVGYAVFLLSLWLDKFNRFRLKNALRAGQTPAEAE